MTIDILSYPNSIANPLMKLLCVLLFAVSAYVFYRCRAAYGGKLQVVATLLLLGGIAGALASAFRFAGDYLTTWKLMESAFFLALAIITLAIAVIVRKKFRNAAVLFGMPQEGERE